jgi:hypothetical protein
MPETTTTTTQALASVRSKYDAFAVALTYVEDRRERLRALWEMTPEARIAAMYRGELTTEQCLAWAARYPQQVPSVNGEWAFIAMKAADLDED